MVICGRMPMSPPEQLSGQQFAVGLKLLRTICGPFGPMLRKAAGQGVS